MKAELIEKEFVFEADPRFASCHASTVAATADGAVLSAWFGGSGEGADDVGIWLSRKEGGSWAEPVLMAGEPGLPHWNPVLFAPGGATVLLYYKVGKTIPAWRTLVRRSDDAGASWTTPRELVPGDAGGRGPVKNKPIVLSSGAWLAPASVEGKYWDAFADRSEDGGLTWTASPTVGFVHDDTYEGTGLIQPSLWESGDRGVHMLLRSRTGRIWRSDSADGGATWSKAYPTYLPNNSSGIDLDRTGSGILVLAYNPVGMPKGPRSPLVLGLSADEGETWKQGAIVEIEPGEFSYPAVLVRKNEVHLAYTWNRERIAYRRYRIEA
ncbi:MAG: neuraminidase (sialidase) [Treponema sp. GWB1_62_6]|nr:MAG: neuraminidase (sialidase) [Treponema sp. GWC1_61_84]OHE65043.1 MAG: neuraminidase (sialidase) [Treponema sp. GWB1_62_6]HCM28124.1 neuraminidase (sialidase) [Treponema sp.]